jgi:quercetin dioxygenase-like cupin family protein
MYFCDVENRETMEIMPGVRIRSFWGDRMLVCAVELDEGAVVPAHSHPHEQAGTVIAGQMELTIGDETRVVEPGDVWLIPGEVEHKAIARRPTRLFEQFSPVREAYKY